MREIPNLTMADILQIITFLKLYLPRWLITLLIVYIMIMSFYAIGGICNSWLINFVKGLLVNLQGIYEECLVPWICQSERKLILKELFLNSFIITCTTAQNSFLYIFHNKRFSIKYNLFNYAQFILK